MLCGLWAQRRSPKFPSPPPRSLQTALKSVSTVYCNLTPGKGTRVVWRAACSQFQYVQFGQVHTACRCYSPSLTEDPLLRSRGNGEHVRPGPLTASKHFTEARDAKYASPGVSAVRWEKNGET